MTWTGKKTCPCARPRYSSETAAARQAAAENRRCDPVVTAYRCEGSRAWHLTGRGFQPTALRSAARRLAHRLVAHPAGVLLDDFRATTLGQRPGSKPWKSTWRTANRLVALGAAAYAPDVLEGETQPRLLLADDRAARRIVQIGLDAYIEETSRPALEAAPG
ncbi:hypothetical protein [Actinoplanes sp. NBRC 101535]|uniref:hypothetical protein n=1 Tax=Actinoplanes sp. NBRC 101535 TaxID=3032196 RepID=UPI0024A0E2A7|nr:hypothetical protein [Actinoplanes sp. NBRC 101535]GLY08283.1 hypothetical protein Acsp01_86620 [Actinoplanes sp. NBRC 101535]